MQNAQVARASRSAPAPVGGGARPVVSGSGILFGCGFFAASLTPSLVPRDAIMQGLVGGTVFAVGYGIAVTTLALWRWLELAEPDRRYAVRWAIVSALSGVALIAYCLSRTSEWQNAIHEVMGMPPVAKDHGLLVLAITAGTALVLFFLAWLLRLLVRAISDRLRPFVPPRVAVLVGLVAAFVTFGALVDGVLVRYVYSVLDTSYARLDQLVPPDTAEPVEPWRTGSPRSLVPWDTIGRDGRRFLDGLSTRAELAAFWDRPVAQPARVYVGLNSAEDADARAALALDELLRVGAFDRSVLVVAMPTGTGFMDEGAIDTLEYLHRGDTATVAVQYSYLQSPFSLIFEPEYGAETARALLRTVYEHWSSLPPDSRPRLFLYGLSLGTLHSERSIRLHEIIADPLDGALWAGPPFLSPIHSEVTANRAPGSPEWLPRFEDGSLVRFMNQYEMTDPDAEWGPIRIIYLQHASDPIVFFGFPIFWRRPTWLEAPRAPDVTDAMRWYPVITALQIAADMALSNNVPRGYGHQYAPGRYLDSWTRLTEPDVSDADLARLQKRFGQ